MVHRGHSQWVARPQRSGSKSAIDAKRNIWARQMSAMPPSDASCRNVPNNFEKLHGINYLALSVLFENLARDTETLKRLWDTTIDADDVDDCTNFLFRDTIANRPFAMDFPFGHFSKRTNHR
jgi:hypothetical protein